MSHKLYQKVNKGKRPGQSKPMTSLKPFGVTQDNYSFDYSVNIRDVEKFALCKRFLANDVGMQHGECSNIIDYGEHYQFHPPDRPQPPEDSDDEEEVNEAAFERMQYQIEYGAYIKTKNQYESRCVQVYHLIWSKCTVAMRNAVKQNPQFAVWDQNKDALALWLHITEISINGVGEESLTKRIQEARHRWDKLHQRQTELVGEFYDRFQEHYDAMVSQGTYLIQPMFPDANHVEEDVLVDLQIQHRQSEERMKAMAFLNKLDKGRFGNMLDELRNAEQFGRDEYPVNLVDAYALANAYREKGLRVDGMISKGKELNYEAAFVTAERQTKSAAKETNSNKKGGKKGNGGEIKCFHCDKDGHTRANCVLMRKALDYFAKSGKTIQELQQSYKVLVTFHGLEQYILKSEVKPFTDNDVLLDNQASVSAFNNGNLLTNIREADVPITIQGVSKGKLVIYLVGEFLGNTVYYHPDLVANILCFFDYNKKYSIKFERNCFKFSVDGKEYVFVPRNKFYVHTFKQQQANNAEKLFTTHSVTALDVPASQVTLDVSDQVNNVMKSEVQLDYLKDGDELRKSEYMVSKVMEQTSADQILKSEGHREGLQILKGKNVKSGREDGSEAIKSLSLAIGSQDSGVKVSNDGTHGSLKHLLIGNGSGDDWSAGIGNQKIGLVGDGPRNKIDGNVPVTFSPNGSCQGQITHDNEVIRCQNEAVRPQRPSNRVGKVHFQGDEKQPCFSSYLDNPLSNFNSDQTNQLPEASPQAFEASHRLDPPSSRFDISAHEYGHAALSMSSQPSSVPKIRDYTDNDTSMHTSNYQNSSTVQSKVVMAAVRGDVSSINCDVSQTDFGGSVVGNNFYDTESTVYTDNEILSTEIFLSEKTADDTSAASVHALDHYNSMDYDNFIHQHVLVNTVDDNLIRFTKRDLKNAELAKRLYTILGKPSVKDFYRAVKHNLIRNCPITTADIDRAITIFGNDLGAIKGRTISRKPLPIGDDVPIRRDPDNTILYVDVCFVFGIPFFITISKGYNLLVVRYINNRKTETLAKAIEQVVAVYKKHNVNIQMIVCDGEGAISALRTVIEGMGVQLEVSSKNEHVVTAERAIRQLKERIRSFVNSLPFVVTKEMLVYLVMYLAFMINNFPRSTSLIEDLSPREKLTGRKLDFKVDCKLEFGDYVQANEENAIKNSMQSRTFPAICLGPVGNIQGSYYFLNLNTWAVVRRRSWILLPLPNEVIQKINAKANRERVQATNGQAVSINELDFEAEENEDVDEDGEDKTHQSLHNFGNIPDDQHIQDASAVQEWDYNPQYFREEVGNDLDEADQTESSDEAAVDVPHPYNLRDTAQRRARAEKRALALLSWKVMNMFATYNTQKAIKDWGDEARESMKKEMKQLHDKDVFEPVHYSSLSSKQKISILRSLMHTKRKRSNVLKSRFLADGSKQDRLSSAVDPSSPTVSTEALFITAAIDAMEKRYHATVDVEGAYLHCLMVGEVLIRIEAKIVDLLVQIDPKYEQFRCNDGSIIVRLKKALYGCIQSARLFYENLSNALTKFGFKKNDYDDCVFNKDFKGKQCTVVIHVDDLKISCEDSRGVEETLNELKRVYGSINVHKEDVIDYLGMDLDYSTPGVVKISMMGLTEQVLEDVPVTKASRTPATAELFSVSSDSAELETVKKEKFHSVVAKLLYMAKRARPDILTSVAFLTTRVQVATQQDWNKLERLVQYLYGTKDLALYLNASSEMTINAFIDASFACHPDGKSHTGEMITLGGGAVISKSSKQKLVTRSSTEAELVGLADGIPTILWTKNFLEAQGFEIQPAIVHQDNKSTIILAEKGKSTTNRTRHINIRYFFVKDRIESKDIHVEYTPTDEMVADFFSKPLQGALFERFRAIILNTPQ